MQYNEKDLIEQCQKGTTEAFGPLYDRHIKTIYTFIYYKTRHKETAEDITSQTFFKALKNIGSVDTSRSFLSWLYKIAHNSVLDHYRTKREHQDIDDVYDLNLNDDTDIVQTLDDTEEVKRAKKHLENLSSFERDIVMMRIWQELSYKEIAEIVGKTEASCKMTYSRALKKLRDTVSL